MASGGSGKSASEGSASAPSGSLQQRKRLSSVCDTCKGKMQLVADLLLLSSETRPVMTSEGVAGGRHLRAVPRHGHRPHQGALHPDPRHPEPAQHGPLHRGGWTTPGSQPCLPGLVDRYKVTRCRHEVDQSCGALRVTPLPDLTPQLLLELSQNISTNLKTLTDISSLASERSRDPLRQRAVQAEREKHEHERHGLPGVRQGGEDAAQRADPEPLRPVQRRPGPGRQRPGGFATEPQFLGRAASISAEGKGVQTAVLGGAMSVVSACVLLTQGLRDMADYRERLRNSACAALRERSSPRTLPPVNSHSVN
uniref:Talin rod domain containing 1 n=1 Tax=Salarias fasciatus TaxID=181472 RepID=A0A672GLT6_SALFA